MAWELILQGSCSTYHYIVVVVGIAEVARTDLFFPFSPWIDLSIQEIAIKYYTS